MQQVHRHLIGVICLAALFSALLPAAELALGLTAEAYAQSAGALGRIETKVSDVVTLIQNVLSALTAVAVAFVGFKFIKGDPDAWSFALKALVGVVIIYGATSLVQWLST